MADTIETAQTAETQTAPAPETEPTGKTYSEDYVHSLREENKSYRTQKKTFETALKGILGTDNLEDLDQKISAYNQAQAKAVEDANKRTDSYIIENELSKIISNGYNEKLTRKLLDYSGISVKDGKVEGLAEAVQKLEEEYPEVKKQKAPTLANGTGTSKTDNKEDEAVAKFRKSLGLK